MVEAGKLVLVSRGSRGLSLSCSWGRPVPIIAGTPVPVEAEAIVPVEAGVLFPVKARWLVPVSRGNRDLYLLLQLGRLVPVEAGTLAAAEAGALVPVEAGALVPVEAVVLVPVSNGSQDLPHTAQAMDTTTGRELPLFSCLS